VESVYGRPEAPKRCIDAPFYNGNTSGVVESRFWESLLLGASYRMLIKRTQTESVYGFAIWTALDGSGRLASFSESRMAIEFWTAWTAWTASLL
jgi:hypothetical protein